MRQTLQKLSVIRFVLISVFMLMGLVFQLKGISIFWGPYRFFLFFIIVLYVTSGTFLLLLKKTRNLVGLTYGLFGTDAIVVTGIVYVTGGSLSVFFPIYILIAMEAGAVLERPGGLLAASVSSILYGLLLNLEYHWIIPALAPRYPYHSFYMLYKLLLAIIIFYLAGYLTGYLAEEVRRRGSELTKTQEDYRWLEAFNQNVIQSIQSGLMTCGLDNNITFVNQAGEQILGAENIQLRGTPLLQVFRDVKEDISREEIIYRRPDGNDMVLGLTSSPLKDHNGELMGKIIAFRDVTHIREMEEAMRRSEKLATAGQLAAGIAHEIRNPLASISGAIQLLREEKQNSEHHTRLMDIIVTESNRLNRLITDFLLYAQPPVLNTKMVNLSALVDDTLAVFSQSPQWTQGIKLEKTIEPDLILNGDAQQLQQVLWNLFINAVNAMDGKGCLGVVTKKERKSRKIRLIVGDTGVGIAPEHLKKIFDPFFTTREGGTGLGLSIVHKIVETHGGGIRVESEPKKGTTFTLTFPMV